MLILDAGDQITGTPVSSFFKGKPVYHIMNTMRYDCAVLGNHEFDHGWQHIPKLLEIAQFPILCSNVFTPEGELIGDAPHAIFHINDIEIGVIGVLTSDLYSVTNISSREGLRINEVISSVQSEVTTLRDKCHLIVVLSHCGLEEDKRIAASVDGIDVIVGGHAHIRLDRSLIINGAIIVQAGSYTECVGRLDLGVSLDDRKVVSHKAMNVTMDSTLYPPDPSTQTEVERWESLISPLVDVQIGNNPSAKSPEQLAQITAMILKNRFKTNFGYQNPGGTRERLPEGPITKRHIWSVYPFDDRVAVVRVNAAMLKRFFQIVPDSESLTEYSVATNSFVCSKILEQGLLPESTVDRFQTPLRDIVIEYIEKHGNLEMEISPQAPTQ